MKRSTKERFGPACSLPTIALRGVGNRQGRQISLRWVGDK